MPDLHTAQSSLNTIDPLAREQTQCEGGGPASLYPNRHRSLVSWEPAAPWPCRRCLTAGMKPRGSSLSFILGTTCIPQLQHPCPVPSTLDSPSTERPGPMDLYFEMFSCGGLFLLRIWLLVGKGVGLCVPLGHL